MGQMANKGLADMESVTPAGVVWVKASQALKSELGDDTFGSWLAQACLRAAPDGELCLVTPTGIARDWIARYAWRRIGELWAANDPQGRVLRLKSRLEFEAEGGELAARPLEIEAVTPISTDSPVTAPLAAGKTSRTQRAAGALHFRNLRAGPIQRVRLAVASGWRPGPTATSTRWSSTRAYGFGKTHLLNALAWEAMRTAPEKKVVYLTAERFLSSLRAGADGAQGRGLQGGVAFGRPAADRRRPLHRRQATHRRRAVPHPGGPDGGRPPGGVLRRPAALGAH